MGTANKNGYFLIRDGGHTWHRLDYGGYSWIYSAVNDLHGNAWMGGLNKEIYRTKDYGTSWKTIHLPLDKSDRIYKIDMSDATYGIAATDNSEIITTQDDWSHIQFIETPHHQRKYADTSEEGMRAIGIESVFIWHGYYVVQQNGQAFYTPTESIDWKAFPIAVNCFAKDQNSTFLYAATRSSGIVVFKDPAHFEKIKGGTIEFTPASMQMVNGNVYLTDNSGKIYKYSAGGRSVNSLYTTDHEIRDMDRIKSGKKLRWGTKDNGLYLSEKNNEGWHREVSLDFSIRDIKLLEDSTVVLWDGRYHNYVYGIKLHSLFTYVPDGPVETFLSSPVIDLSLDAGSAGCFHRYSGAVSYARVAGADLDITRATDEEGNPFENFRHTVSTKEIRKLLERINDHMINVPAYADFGITLADKQRCLDNAIVQDTMPRYTSSGRSNAPSDYCRSVLPHLDTVSKATIKAMLEEDEGMISTTRNWFKVRMVNGNKDTLTFERYYYNNAGPYFLPWQISWNGFHYTCYDLELSRFFNSCIPDKFFGKRYFDNSLFLYQLASYLYREQKS